MKIPAYWSQATATETDRTGQPFSFSCWRSSDTSREAAHAAALSAAARIVQKLIRGERLDRYGYGQSPLREDVIQWLGGEQDGATAAVTQNAYGSLVLNTARVMFLDVDFPDAAPADAPAGIFSRLFGRKAAAPAEKDARSPQADAMRKVEGLLSDHPQFGLRVYRTMAGLRVLVTHALFDPGADSTRQLMESIGTDPLYVRLCRAQQCFRARLTPKPWRCDHTANHVAWPREDEKERLRFEKWQAKYLERQAKYATCRFLTALGSDAVHPEAEPVIEIHDRLTRCGEALELA